MTWATSTYFIETKRMLKPVCIVSCVFSCTIPIKMWFFIYNKFVNSNRQKQFFLSSLFLHRQWRDVDVEFCYVVCSGAYIFVYTCSSFNFSIFRFSMQHTTHNFLNLFDLNSGCGCEFVDMDKIWKEKNTRQSHIWGCFLL